MKIIKQSFIYLLFLVALAGCAHEHADTASEERHEDNLQLTAYGDSLEVFAEVSPLAKGEKSRILAHLTYLSDFKPVEEGKVTARLILGGDTLSQTLPAPTRPGVYEFFLTPGAAGEGTLQFIIRSARVHAAVALPRVRVYADGKEAERHAEEAVSTCSNGVTFTKEQSWKVDFATQPCRREPFGQVVKATAQILPSPQDEQTVTAKVSGTLSFMDNGMVKGRQVSKGKPLFVVRGDEVADNNIGVRYQAAEAEYNRAKAEYDRKSDLRKDKIVTESEWLSAKTDYDIAAASYQNLRRHFAAGRQTVASPIDGNVVQLYVQNGDYVQVGQKLAVVSRNRTLLVQAEIQPKYLSALGNVATVNFRSLRDDKVFSLQEADGSLVSVGKATDAGNPLVPVVFQVKNVADLIPGTFVEAYIATRGDQPVVTVPNAAIVEEMGSYFVFVQRTPEYFEKRIVSRGATDGQKSEITAGLTGDERIVSQGAVMVKLAQAAGTLDPHAGHAH